MAQSLSQNYLELYLSHEAELFKNPDGITADF